MTQSIQTISPLRQRMIDDMRLRKPQPLVELRMRLVDTAALE